MKKSMFAAAIAALALVACKKTETTATEVGADSTATAVAVPADSMPVMTDSTAAGNIQNTMEGAAQGTTEVAKDAKDGAVNAADATVDAAKAATTTGETTSTPTTK